MPDPERADRLAETLRRFESRRTELKRFVARTRTSIDRLAEQVGLRPLIVAEVISLDRFADLADALDPVPDDILDEPSLCSIVVAVHTRDQIAVLERVLERALALEELPPEEGDALPGPGDQDGERSFLVRAKPKRGAPPGPVGELRIQTLIGYAWAQIRLDLGRRNELRLPAMWQQELATIDARLEECDWGMEAISEAIGTYAGTYDAYMTSAELETLVSRLEAVLEVSPTDIDAAERLVRAYAALDDNAGRARALFESHQPRLGRRASALREVGSACCREHPPKSEGFNEGRALLDKAVSLDPSDVDAVCELGDAYQRCGDLAAATRCFKTGLGLDPTNPKPLSRSVVDAMLQAGEVEAVDQMRAMIPLAADRCETQARAGINLPWAFFDLGLFHLLEERPAAAFGAYAAGVQLALRGWMVRAAGAAIRDLEEREIDLTGLASMRWLLDLGAWARSSAASRSRAEWTPPRGGVRFRKKILVLAGHGTWEGELDSPLVVLKEALKGFKGTLVAGGVRSGTAAVAGDLQEQLGPRKVRTVGYTRQTKDAAEPPDARYTDHRTVDMDAPFMAEALSFWQDLLAAKGDPTAVRVLSVGGGSATRCELQLALAFGARVGVLEDSEGPAGEEFLGIVGRQNWPAGAAAVGNRGAVNRVALATEDILEFVEGK